MNTDGWHLSDEESTPKKLTKNPLGPSGRAVAANIRRLLDEQNLKFVDLANRLKDLGRPIPPLGLRKIVGETRRVDADDLVALAVALGVSPVSLLMPKIDTAEEYGTAVSFGTEARTSAMPGSAVSRSIQCLRRAAVILPLAIASATVSGWRVMPPRDPSGSR